MKTKTKQTESSNECGGFRPPKGHLDTQMYPECEGTPTDRNIVKKTVEKRKKKKHKKKSSEDLMMEKIAALYSDKKIHGADKDEEPEKFERCVQKMKKKQAFNLKQHKTAMKTHAVRVPGETEFGFGLNEEAMKLLSQYNINNENLFRYDSSDSGFQDIYAGLQAAKSGDIETLKQALEARFGKKHFWQKNIF